MIRYRLDDLGWYQFEWLVQSLLKAELGLGIESWGGHKDHGRDAFTASQLRFPDKNSFSEGPFVFQAKFVENANAAGANNEPALLGAVSKEAARILRRRQSSFSALGRHHLSVHPGKEIRHYTLITNAILSPSIRESIHETILKVLPTTEIHLMGGGDICDLLDRHISLRRSFPQLLSIRDLDELLSEVVNRDIIEKSKAAIDIAKDVAAVFVPTRAYDWAWETLRTCHLVVLEGPPEVGKTAIAWMLALGQLLSGWQVVVCDEPEEFFGSLREGERQIFVSDDAFGRTEYDPARGRKWENQLERVLKRLDAHHWFVWTTRKHIFERALRDLDLQGASQFHKAGTLVDAAHLSTKDKALILYRHAKAAVLPDEAKELLRQNLETVVYAREFTPERIRRFVRERLPELTDAFNKKILKVEDIKREINEAIRNPTDRMRKTFQKLSVDHKWVLISLFECGRRAEIKAVEEIYRMRISDEKESFNIILDDLREAFVTIRESYIDWIHPSYRDLVIEELAADKTLRQRVLTSISLSGLKVAVSDTSGPLGEKKYPLIASSSDWKLLMEGCVKLVVNPPEIATDALQVLASAVQNAADTAVRDELSRIIYDVCEAIRYRWDVNGTIFSADQLLTFCDSSLLAGQLPALPNLAYTWTKLEERLLTNLPLWEAENIVDCDIVEGWIKFARVIADNEPRFLRLRNFPAKYLDVANRIVAIINSDVAGLVDFESSDLYMAQSNEYDRLVKVIESMQYLDLIQLSVASSLMDLLEERSSEYSERARELGDPDPDYDYEPGTSGEEFIDLNEFFRDLYNVPI